MKVWTLTVVTDLDLMIIQVQEIFVLLALQREILDLEFVGMSLASPVLIILRNALLSWLLP